MFGAVNNVRDWCTQSAPPRRGTGMGWRLRAPVAGRGGGKAGSSMTSWVLADR